jgi:hypothetical protein
MEILRAFMHMILSVTILCWTKEGAKAKVCTCIAIVMLSVLCYVEGAYAMGGF